MPTIESHGEPYARAETKPERNHPHGETGVLFFRLNGCLTTENFVVHPDGGRDQRTVADILGVRFPPVQR